MPLPRVIIDWSKIKYAGQFYDVALPQCGSPEWHGRNLNALNDSWVTGDICTLGPPFNFTILNQSAAPYGLIGMANSVLEIINDSIATNGGSLTQS